MSQLHDVTRALFRYPHTHLIQVLQQIRQLATNLDAVDPFLTFSLIQKLLLSEISVAEERASAQ